MRAWTPEQLAAAAEARMISPPPSTMGPERVITDSREARPGSLFVGLPGTRTHGGRFAAQALAAGAWGVLTTPDHAEAARCAPPGVLLAAADPLAALQKLATAWRREIGAKVIGVTGSTGKTSTKDLILALIGPHRRTVASRANFNTEIGLPLEILSAPSETEVLVLEMGMRGPGQIDELARIAEPGVGIIVSLGPVHLEIMKTIEAIAAAKAELIAALPPGGTAIIPAHEPLLEPHRRDDVDTVTFGEDADVRLVAAQGEQVTIDSRGEIFMLEVPFTQAHLRSNLLAAVAAAQAIGITPSGRIDLALSPGRGQRIKLDGGVTLIDDCYNANPISMRAALDDLAATASLQDGARQVAVLGDMLELGPNELGFHRDLGAYAHEVGVALLITVGPLAATMAESFQGEAYATADAAEAAALVQELVEPADVVLVKGSRGVGLEIVCRGISAGAVA